MWFGRQIIKQCIVEFQDMHSSLPTDKPPIEGGYEPAQETWSGENLCILSKCAYHSCPALLQHLSWRSRDLITAHLSGSPYGIKLIILAAGENPEGFADFFASWNLR